MLLKKYQSIIVAIAAFLVLVISILGINVYISYQLEANSERVNLAGRQRMLSQRIAKSLESGTNAVLVGSDSKEYLEELSSSAELFDSTLTAFENGGPTKSTSNTPITIKAIDHEVGAQAIKKGQDIWKTLRTHISLLSNNIDGVKFVREAAIVLAKASKLSKEESSKLLAIMNALTTEASRNKTTDLVNIVGRQRTLSQQISKSILEVQESVIRSEDYSKSLQELLSSTQTFDRTLKALKEGGETVNTQGETVFVNAMESEFSKSLLYNAEEVWNPIKSSVEMMEQKFGNVVLIKRLMDIQKARSFSSKHANDLLFEMNALTNSVEKEGSQNAGLLRMVQIIGVLVALLAFAFIMQRFFSQVSKSDAIAEEALHETDKILETVDQGLFLLGNDHVIGEQHSTQMSYMFGEPYIAGRNFSDFLRNRVSEKDLNTAQGYFGLLFDKNKKERLLGALNPLKEIAVQVPDGRAGFEDKFLKFGFRRVESETGEIERVLGTVSDVTREVMLKRDLEASEKRNSQQFEILSAVLNSNVDMMPLFVKNYTDALSDINDELKKKSKLDSEFRQKANAIFAKIHGIKGEAAALDLTLITDECHAFEAKINTILDNETITGKDFLSLTVSLEQMIAYNQSLKELLSHLSSIGFCEKNEPLTTIQDHRINWDHLYEYADTVAQRNGKKVELTIVGLNDNQMNENFVNAINMISTQMIRNSIAHGIETPKQRKTKNKSHTGKIAISLANFRDGGYQLTYFDDGAGVDIDTLETKAVKVGIIKAEDLELLTQSKKLALMFHPKLSSVDEVDIDKGQGVGLFAVKQKICELGGSIGITNNTNVGVRFTIKFPEDCNIIPVEEASQYSLRKTARNTQKQEIEIWT